MADTVVTFASGATSGEGRVQAIVPGGRVGPHGPDAPGVWVIVDQTPFHPVDHVWPDQPGDTGYCDGAPVVGAVMAAAKGGGPVFLGPAIPVRRGEPGWEWYVAHGLGDDGNVADTGHVVSLEVDPERRRALSAAHTACHLASLAMNHATAGLWRKPVREDALGRPDLDQVAIQSSVMDERGSTDVYRLGKSLRKKGFDSVGLADQLAEVVAEVEQTLRGWVAAEAPVIVDDGGDRRVTAPRYWTCELPDGPARLACGGTHLHDLGQLAEVQVDYDLDPEGTALTVRTTPTLR